MTIALPITVPEPKPHSLPASGLARANEMIASDVSLPRSKLTIIIPCYNERGTIVEIIRRVRALPIDLSIVVIDNCSTDGTREVLRSMWCSAERTLTPAGQTILRGDGFFLMLQPRNLQKGTSVRAGLALANSEYVIC